VSGSLPTGRGALPFATYRLQFNRQFTFDDAAAVVPYLKELGVTHCYASPYLKARCGSPHGYDIVDHNAINPEIGNERSFARYLDALAEHGMRQILDVVPNHMGVGGDDNNWWLDVLENGPSSDFASFFDIDWFSNKEELRGKVLVPVLGAHYGTVLENGELHLSFDRRRGEFSIWYYNHRFPLEPRTYPRLLELSMERLVERLGPDSPRLAEYQTLSTAFGHLPSRWETATAKVDERRRDKEVHKRHLADLCEKCSEVADHLDFCVRGMNGEPGDPGSFDRLHALLEEQVYRLAYWQVASDEINYRRFFDINDLAGLRIEEAPVFSATHRLVLRLIAEGKLAGLRIDHPDGLYDPAAYYGVLKEEIGVALADVARSEGFYLVVEKILASYERLVDNWPVHGTTGYDFLNLVNGLFVHGAGQTELERIYTRFIGQRIDFDDVLFVSKRQVIELQLSSELTVLANMLDDIAQRDRHTRDFTLNGCRTAIVTFVASFPVYRTYIREWQVSDEDRRYVDWAVALAKKRTPAADVSLFDFIRDLLVEQVKVPESMRRARAAHFAMKLQQYTAPVMAKAMEDTAFYIYNRLISLNEVGGDPRRFSTSPAAFHHANQERSRQWPFAMLATSTHDTKRSEDVRARINVLSEIPEEWRTHVARWSRLARNKKVLVDGVQAPVRNDEYLFYQTLIGAWPAGPIDEQGLDPFRERIKRYMLKAVKEAKVATSWINPNVAYEESVCQFVERMLNNSPQNPFLADFIPFQRKVARFGYFNALSQTLLKLTSPGVPDIYQGTEVWDFSLVDPDNRRPVDYRRRREMLHKLTTRARRQDGKDLARELLDTIEDGRAKLYVIWRTLQERNRRPEVFGGDYVPLSVHGSRAPQVCALARKYGGEAAVVVAPRCMVALVDGDGGLPLASVWGDTRIEVPVPSPGRAYRDAFTGRVCRATTSGGMMSVPVSGILESFPVALLVQEEAAESGQASG
jgi:(1->4)-alpha-D-glucan 1-alpha-D-glucosylmutase